jgi:hypothetical protein
VLPHGGGIVVVLVVVVVVVVGPGQTSSVFGQHTPKPHSDASQSQPLGMSVPPHSHGSHSPGVLQSATQLQASSVPLHTPSPQGGIVVVVVMDGPARGAQTSFAALGVTVRLPNWSAPGSVGRVAFGHFTL